MGEFDILFMLQSITSHVGLIKP